MKLEMRQQTIQEVVSRMNSALAGLEACYAEVVLGFHAYLRMQMSFDDNKKGE